VRHVGAAPLVGRDVDAHLRAREAGRVRHGAGAVERPPDPHATAPRVVVDPELGVLAAGAGPAEVARTLEVFEHVIWIAERAAALGGHVPPPESALAAAAARAGDPSAPDLHRSGRLAGRVALVTGAGSPLGRATVRALVGAGAAVVGLDADAHVPELDGGPAYVGVPGDPADATVVEAAVDRAVRSFGGLDVLVVGAAAAAPDDPVAALSPAAWQRALDGGAGGALAALQAAHPFLRLAPAGAAVVVVAPACAGVAGAAAGDALTRLARAAAREWAGDGIRVNVVQPGPVVHGGPGGDAPVGAAATGDVGGATVSPGEVAATVVALCGPDLGRTTGARIPVGADALPV
jgi:NAD(P)-dependent dehydrogenase (short-subunit alcohol dehydrogenase family)